MKNARRPSNQFLLCFLPPPRRPPSFLNYKPFHPSECRTISPPLLLPFIPIRGGIIAPLNPPRPPPPTPRQPPPDPLLSPPTSTPRLACCEMRQQGPFSDKLAAISAIMLIFACALQQEASFRCAARCPRETATKQKLINQQRPRASGSTADNTGHIPS